MAALMTYIFMYLFFFNFILLRGDPSSPDSNHDEEHEGPPQTPQPESQVTPTLFLTIFLGLHRSGLLLRPYHPFCLLQRGVILALHPIYMKV